MSIRSLLMSGSRGRLVEVEALAPGKRRWHSVDGVIEITVGGTPIVTAAEWDDIADLWSYVATLVDRMCAGDPQAETSFPDQPVTLRLVRKGGAMMEIACETGDERRRAVAPADELIRALCTAGVSFFDNLVRLGAPPENYRSARDVLLKCAEMTGPATPDGDARG
ncbi:hypothetical protein ACFOHP_04555 [Couchioplanes caeruleus subsp. azureus]|uniref:hypothetical protein n=1 Tax=Couchioplanes caeruleus TaxID=56438 RepID=UPI0016704A94